MSKKTFYIIDGTAYIHRAFHALPPLNTSIGTPVNAVYGFIKMIIKIIQTNNPDYCIVCFDFPAKNFRHKMYKEYKATRKKMPDQMREQVPLVKKSVDAMGIASIELEGYEADDIIASLVENIDSNKFDTVVISGDKDIFQLINDSVTVKAEPKNVTFDKQKVVEKFGVKPNQLNDYFALLGDSSDNIPGCKGIGKVTAGKLINEFNDIDTLLINLDKVPLTTRKKIIDSKDNLIMSRTLVKLKTDISFSQKDIEKYRLHNAFKSNEFKTFLEMLEFNKLVETMFNKVDENDLFSNEAVKIDYKKIDSFQNLPPDEYALATFKSEGKPDSLLLYSKNQGGFYIEFTKIIDNKIDFIEFTNNPKTSFYIENLKELSKDLKKIDKDFLVKVKLTNFFDIIVASYICDASMRNLKDMAIKYLDQNFNETETLDNEFVKLSIIYSLKNIVIDNLKKCNLEKVYWNTEIPFCTVLADMEEKGIKVDVDYLNDLNSSLVGEIDCLVKTIYKEAGEEFNINSPKQLAQIIFDKLGLPILKRTKTGPSTSEYVLSRLSEFHELPKHVLKYRTLAKLASTYTEPIISKVNEKTKRLHTSFNHTLTATGRLSSSNPNMQNIPTKNDISVSIRKAFVSEKDTTLVSADYSQIDLAVLAHFSDDPTMLESFKLNKDIHIKTASLIFDVDENNVSDFQRNIAKRINFGLVYGMSAFGLARDLDIGIDEASDFIKKYFERYPKVKEYIETTIEKATSAGYIETLFARRRYIPELSSRIKNIRSMGERIAVNTPIQGSASDIIKKSMLDLSSLLKKDFPDAHILLQIHDELIFEIPDNCLSDCLTLIKQTMENSVKLNLPIKVNLKKGKNWEDME
ncbi:DNA polymerase I [bacterium]